MKCIGCLFLCLLYAFASHCQTNRKKCTALRTYSPVKIDGNLSEESWKSAPLISGFTENRPVTGKKQRPELNTEVRILYDNTSIYIGAIMHDVSADSISREIAQRDQVGNADFFMVFIDTYNTGINGNGFMLTSSNSQYDARYSNENNGEDASWNAVWESAAKTEGNNWVAEMRIPYSALRFAKKDVQTWGINFMSRRLSSQQDFFWNPVDPVVSGFVNQWGILDSLQNIKPPVRLSFSPYFSSYLDHYPYNTPGAKNTSTYVNGGMDVKYGINQSFTLDMTLIPDFGQVQSDNTVLNLTPFEVKYNENRSFFTEGTELFNKGNLFYSRRIGGIPVFHDSLQNLISVNDKVLSNPIETKLINAAKISGRTKKGLGLGVFNALTESTFALVAGDSGREYSIRTAPLTNYNILVADQSLKNNSSVTFINTNVQRGSRAYDANVTSGLFNFFTKKNLYNLNGQFNLSQKYGNIQKAVGTKYLISGGKSSGKFTANFSHSVMDNKYDQNDLGILFNNNQIDDNLNINYSLVKPGRWYNSLYSGLNETYSQRYLPRSFQSFNTGAYINSNLKNLWQMGLNVNWMPFESNDFYEPRTAGRVFIAPSNAVVEIYLNTSQAKKYKIYLDLTYRRRNLFGATGADLIVDHRYRFSNKFSIEQSIQFTPNRNYTGYVTSVVSPENIIFGRRNVNTVEHIVFGKYTFNSRSGINIRIRHYYSEVDYKEFFVLDREGRLGKTTYNQNNNINFNLFNIDCIYSWWFAPGSQISLSWKNAIQASSDKRIIGYLKNLGNTIQSPQQNSISFKILYYIDYIRLQTRFKKNPATRPANDSSIKSQ